MTVSEYFVFFLLSRKLIFEKTIVVEYNFIQEKFDNTLNNYLRHFRDNQKRNFILKMLMKRRIHIKVYNLVSYNAMLLQLGCYIIGKLGQIFLQCVFRTRTFQQLEWLEKFIYDVYQMFMRCLSNNKALFSFNLPHLEAKKKICKTRRKKG